MQLIGSYIALFTGIFLSIVSFRIMIKLIFADKIESSKSANRVNSIKDAILGRARTHDDWIPDARIQGGLVYNERKNRIEVTGRNSDSAFRRVFRLNRPY
jgi:hypothetical protein